MGECIDGVVFVSYEEEKCTVWPKKVLKFHLFDRDGNKHLAATGEDTGDAHYQYRSTKPFARYGNLECHNRKDVTAWLEMVIGESGGQGDGPHLNPDEQHPEGVYFVTYRNERAHYSDGRRCNRWYLVDQYGNSHLAVVGIERDTKDGHYNYSAEEPFSSITPLHCSNQTGVYKWLEKMITHHPGDTAAGSGADADRKPPVVMKLSTILNARKSAAAISSQQAVLAEGTGRAKPKPSKASGGAAAAATAKHKTVGIVQQMQIKKARKLQEDVRAEEERLQMGHLAKLRHAAAAEVTGDTAAKATALTWLHGVLSEDDQEHLDHWTMLLTTVLDIQQQQQDLEQQQATGSLGLQQQQLNKQQEVKQQVDVSNHCIIKGNASDQPVLDGLHQAADGPGVEGRNAASKAPAKAVAAAAAGSDCEILTWIKQRKNRQHHLRVVLECLKELGALDWPVKVLLGKKMTATVQRCLSYPHQAVSRMAQHMLNRWTWQLAGHTHVLTDTTYMQDHLAELENEIQAGLVPLPQLPQHKQALLNNQLMKLPSIQTPAAGNQQQQQQHYFGPMSAPPALDPVMLSMGQTHHVAQAAYAAGGVSAGYTVPGFGLSQGMQTPTLYTPMGAGTAGPGFTGMDATAGFAATATRPSMGLRGSGIRASAGVLPAGAVTGAQLAYAPGISIGLAARSPAVSLPVAANAVYGQQGVAYVDPQTGMATYAGALGPSQHAMLSGWPAGAVYGGTAGSPLGAAPLQYASAEAGTATAGAPAAGGANPSADAAQAQQAAQQQLALYAYKQQQQQYMLHQSQAGVAIASPGFAGTAGQPQMATLQYVAAVPGQLPQVQAATGIAGIASQQQQQLLQQQWQQRQLLQWQQQGAGAWAQSAADTAAAAAQPAAGGSEAAAVSAADPSVVGV